MLTTKQRVSATIRDRSVRCKVSVIAEAVADCFEALPASATSPYDDHFHPEPSKGGQQNARRVGNPYQAIGIIPLENQVGLLRPLAFCCSSYLKTLFIGDQERTA